MEGNPFPQLLGMMKEAAKGVTRPSFRMGVVQSPSPLSVRIAGLTYQGAELLAVDLLDSRNPGGGPAVEPPAGGRGSGGLPASDGDDMRYLVLAKAVAV